MTEEPKNSPLVEDTLAIIHNKYPHLYGSNDIAELLEVSSPHLIRCFKKELGTSPTKYLLSYKLERSKLLLLQRDLPIDTVANLVGFSCGNYYAKVFRKHFNQSPTQYMIENQHLKPEIDEEFPELYI